MIYVVTGGHQPAKAGSDEYLLLSYFIEGMCRAADTGTEITDGYEQSYGYRIPAAFREGRDDVIFAGHLFASRQDFLRVGNAHHLARRGRQWGWLCKPSRSVLSKARNWRGCQKQKQNETVRYTTSMGLLVEKPAGDA